MTFADLDFHIAYPRLAGLTMSPDGTRLATVVSTLDAKENRYVNAIWELDPTGERPARRITRSAKGESGAAFAANGDLYFISSRPDPDSSDADDTIPTLWVVPATGGEARPVVTRPGGVGGVHPAPQADAVFITGERLRRAEAADDPEHADADLRKQRKDLKVSAILHTTSGVRYWDADRGPALPQVFALESADPAPPADAGPALPTTVDARPPTTLRHLTPGLDTRLGDALQVAPDGTFLLANRTITVGAGEVRSAIVQINATGEYRDIITETDTHHFAAGPISPDGAHALIVWGRRGTPDSAFTSQLGILDLATGEHTALAEHWDRAAHPLGWFPNGGSVLVQADQDGRGPLFRIDLDGTVTQLTSDDATYSAAAIHPDGGTIFGVRSSYRYPSEVVRVDVASGAVVRLPNPVERPPLPGLLTEIATEAPDGQRIRAWLALPATASAATPAPLLLWIHGGPVMSSNAWSWRWNPWLMVAQGYAVLLPDPALSTGYGHEFIQRGWGRWGAEPYTDLMAITDAAEARDDIDGRRTVAMGGSFGGYMANWIAGHTDRFAAIVTHASLWALDQFGPTTDAPFYWQREMTAEMALAHSPHTSVDKITTPMLVIHGDKDYRVPIGEGLRLWWELLSRSGLPASDDGTSPHRFLYFPDENHWILAPQHAKVWYQVVLGFVGEHVHGTPAALPEVLGV